MYKVLKVVNGFTWYFGVANQYHKAVSWAAEKGIEIIELSDVTSVPEDDLDTDFEEFKFAHDGEDI